MQIQLHDLNAEIERDPEALIARCDQRYNQCVQEAAGTPSSPTVITAPSSF